jgi:hypothetical protein
MQQHPENPAFLARLARPSASFSTASAAHSLRHFALSRAQSNANFSHAGPCPHADEDLIATSRAAREQSSAAALVALLALRSNNIAGNISSSSDSSDSVLIFRSSSLFLDLVRLLPPAATTDLATLLSTACVAAVEAPSSAWPMRAEDVTAFASADFWRLMDLLSLVEHPQQQLILSCARVVMRASAAARAAFRSHGASAVAAAVTVMKRHASLGAAASAAASVLPFICSDRIEYPVNITAFPTLFSSAASTIKSVSSCAQFTPWTASILEGILDLLHACR